MSNGLSNHDSGRPSDGDKKQAPTALLDDETHDETSDTDDTPEDDELSQTLPDSAPDRGMITALEAELISAPRPKHPKRLIEARWEDERLDALLREVYEED